MREGTAVGGTHRVSRFKTSQFRTRLMIGAAGLAAAGVGSTAVAAPAAPATPAPSPKWLPYASVGAHGGDSQTGAQVELFVPVWQDLNSLLFVRFGAGTQTHNPEIGNFSLGYRTKVTPDWILGGYVGFDASHTSHNHTFTQLGLGAELMSADWDARINGYLATQSSAQDTADAYRLYVHDTRIAILEGQEGAYSGFDGEVGYRVFSTDGTDVRLFVGGFNFTRSDKTLMSSGQAFSQGFKDISGPMGRAEVDIYDIDALGTQSRVMVTGQVSHDDVRGTTGYVGASLHIPLGAGWGAGGQALDEIDRRMIDPVRRQDNVLTQFVYSKPEPVIIYNSTTTSQPTNTLYYLDNTAGAGTYKDPTTPQDATTRSATNSFMVATDFDGPIVTTGTTVQSGQTIAAPGTFQVRGANSGVVFNHDFAPGSGTPTFVAASAADNVITLDPNSTLSGVTISGPFNAGIYGHNITSANISDVTIDASQGNYGILINQDQSQDLDLHISNSTITDAALDGVLVNTNVSDGGTSNQTIELTNSTVSGSGLTDVGLVASVSGGSTVSQNILIDPTTIAGGLYGVMLSGYASYGSLTQNVTLSDLTFTGQTYNGIYIDAEAGTSGTVNQTISLTNVTVTGSYATISISGLAHDGGAVTQQIDMSNVTANNAVHGDNIAVRGRAYYGGMVTQTGTWSGVTATGAYDNGVIFAGTAGTGGSVIQNFGIDGLTATGNYYSGLLITGNASDTSGLYGASIVAQYFNVTNSTLTGNGTGLTANTIAFGGYAATLQDLYVGYSTLSGNGTGLSASSIAIYNASTQQNLTLAYDTIDSNTANGLEAAAVGYYGGFSAQNIGIYYSSFDNNGLDGIHLEAGGLLGGNAEQNANIYFSTMDGNGRDGLSIYTLTGGYSFGYYVYYGQTTQNIIAAYDSMSGNTGDGAHIYNKVEVGGQLNQFIYFFGVTADYNGGNGVSSLTYVTSYGTSYYANTPVYQNFYVVGSSASHNGGEGIYVGNYSIGPGYTIQYTTISNTTASYNGGDGIYVYNYAYGPRLAINYVTVSGVDANHNTTNGFIATAVDVGPIGAAIQEIGIANSYFDNNGYSGATFVAYQAYGPGNFGAAIQDVTIQYSDLSGNAFAGLYGYAEAVGYQGRAEQNFNVIGSSLDGNGYYGAYLMRNAHDGVSVPGYSCDTVQGVYGGCAFVRQEVYIAGSDVSYNGLSTYGDGIFVGSKASNYGAIYDQYGRPGAPTLLIVDSTVNYNGGNGLNLYNDISSNSYLFQYVGVVDSTFDYNGSSGIHSFSYVSGGSTMLQRALIYSYAGTTSASYNGRDGMLFVNDAATGSYALDKVAVFSGVDAVGNGAYAPYTGGLVFVNQADGTAVSVGYHYSYNNVLGAEYAGFVGAAYGSGVYQYNHVGYNLIAYNTAGIVGIAQTGAFNYFDVSSYPNTFLGNTADYSFTADGSSTLTVH